MVVTEEDTAVEDSAVAEDTEVEVVEDTEVARTAIKHPSKRREEDTFPFGYMYSEPLR